MLFRSLLVCAFWGIASGIVGAVVVLMGVIAMRPMLNAGYDVRLASGVITAGGTLGILIPPSVMIIVYAAVAGQSVVKLYAAAMFPGFFLAFLYLVYVIGWVLINPKIAPKLPPEQMKAPIRPWVQKVNDLYSSSMFLALIKATLAPAKAVAASTAEMKLSWRLMVQSLITALVPVWLSLVTLGAVWWYVVIHSQPDAEPAQVVQMEKSAQPAAEAPTAEKSEAVAGGVSEPPGASASGLSEPPGASSGLAEPPGSSSGLAEPPGAANDGVQAPPGSGEDEPLQAMGADDAPPPPTVEPVDRKSTRLNSSH